MDHTKYGLYHVEMEGLWRSDGQEPNALRIARSAFSTRWINMFRFSERNGSWPTTLQCTIPDFNPMIRVTGEMIPQTSRMVSAFRPTPSSDGKWLGLLHNVTKTGDRINPEETLPQGI